MNASTGFLSHSPPPTGSKFRPRCRWYQRFERRYTSVSVRTVGGVGGALVGGVGDTHLLGGRWWGGGEGGGVRDTHPLGEA